MQPEGSFVKHIYMTKFFKVFRKHFSICLNEKRVKSPGLFLDGTPMIYHAKVSLFTPPLTFAEENYQLLRISYNNDSSASFSFFIWPFLNNLNST